MAANSVTPPPAPEAPAAPAAAAPEAAAAPAAAAPAAAAPEAPAPAPEAAAAAAPAAPAPAAVPAESGTTLTPDQVAEMEKLTAQIETFISSVKGKAAQTGGGKAHYSFSSTEYHRQNGNFVKRNVRMHNGVGSETVTLRMKGKTKTFRRKFSTPNAVKCRATKRNRNRSRKV